NTTARKSLRFLKNSYLAQVATEVLEKGAAVPHFVTWRGGFGDPAVPGAASLQRAVYFNPAEDELIENDADAASEGPVSVSGSFTFAGVEDAFFAAVFLPQQGGSFEVRTLSDTAATPADPTTEAAYVGAAVGGGGRNSFGLFVGPKDLGLLRSIDPKLGELVNFGKWFGFIAEPLFLALRWVNEHWVQNYGWAIILVTVIINFALLPLKFSSLKSMKKMQSLQPQIAAINEKYKNVGIRDPKKAEQNQEVMALYKKNGVNPMGGCMPMLLQVPFFIAFYTVLTVAIELRGANWLWVGDLSQPEQIPIRILPLAMIGTQFLLQKMTPTTSVDPAQQKVMLLMPLLMGFMFYGVSSGLVLYWLTGNVVGIAQQWFFNKFTPAPAVVETAKPAPVQKKKTSRT
ncbi:MAG: membrane protein insertase YidC, partial [Bryobacteraceae bacterium]